MKAYLATHFFNKAGFLWTMLVAEAIRNEFPELKLYVPQENGEINDKKNNDATVTNVAIYEADTKELLSSDILIACLDGVEIDAGVASEIGVFSGYIEALNASGINAKPRYIIGVYTDMRQDGTGDNHYYINLYTKGAVNKYGNIVRDTHELLEHIRNFISQ